MEFFAKLAQVIFWLSAIAVGAFTVWKHFHESKERRTWEKAKLAKELLDDLDENALALNATNMLGAWDGRWYEREERGQTDRFQVTFLQLAQVLDPNRLPMTSNETYVRDCFDNFLFHLELCFSAVERRLIDWPALEPMLIPLFAGVSRTVTPSLTAYARFLGYHRTAAKLPELIETALTRPPR
jgi:hypothetical protein